jgi:hypothetical protein
MNSPEQTTMLAIAIRDYITEVLPALHRTKKWYEEKSLHEAIEQAARGIDHRGKINVHQFQIRKQAIEMGVEELMQKEQDISQSQNFTELYEVIERITPHITGLSNLWIYDTALRVGFTTRMLPAQIYMQRATRSGAEKILGGKITQKTRPMSDFPEELQILEAYEAEHFLSEFGK